MTYALMITISGIPTEKDLKEVADNLKFVTERYFKFKNKIASVPNDYRVDLTAIKADPTPTGEGQDE